MYWDGQGGKSWGATGSGAAWGGGAGKGYGAAWVGGKGGGNPDVESVAAAEGVIQMWKVLINEPAERVKQASQIQQWCVEDQEKMVAEATGRGNATQA